MIFRAQIQIGKSRVNYLLVSGLLSDLYNYRFHKFAEDRCETDWTIVGSLVSSTFFVYRCNLRAFFQSCGKVPELNVLLKLI